VHGIFREIEGIIWLYQTHHGAFVNDLVFSPLAFLIFMILDPPSQHVFPDGQRI